jgi:hypothetical protein
MLERESVKIPIQGCSSNVARAVCIATSSARMMVLVSSHLVASMKIVMHGGMCTTAAPSLGCHLMSEPSVYTQASGTNFGIQGIGAGGVTALVVLGWPGGPQWVVPGPLPYWGKVGRTCRWFVG